jgi:AraC-like DNA-binding protein
MTVANRGIWEAELYRSGAIGIGRFQWRPDPQRGIPPTRTGAIGPYHLVVIPRVPVRIHQQGSEPFVADTRTAVFYNRFQPYAAQQIIPEAEDTLSLTLDERFILDCVPRESRCSGRRSNYGPLRVTHGPCDGRAFALSEQVRASLSNTQVDALAVEEAGLLLTSHLLRRAYGDAVPGPASPGACGSTERRRREAADAARMILLRHFREPLTLCDLAGAVGLSSYHLCRVFRAHVGTSLHRYRTAARLRAAVTSLIECDVDLASLALRLGFSSQAHFTAIFSRRFGCPPAQFHRMARRGNLRAAITILKDTGDVDG